MANTHEHDHHHHSSSRNIRLAFFLNAGFALLEIAGGLWTNSVAILSDALHDLGDSLSLGLAWMLDEVADKERDERYSYGYKRFSLLGAFLNIVILFAGSIWVLTKSIPRLLHPEPVHASGMLLFAIVGITINGLAAIRLKRDHSLNARVVALHLLEDVLGWAAVLIVSITLLFTKILILDALLSIGITLFILYNVIRNLKKTGQLFLQAIPEKIDTRMIDEQILALKHVKSTHHTHCWSLDGEHHVLSTHVVLEDGTTQEAIEQTKCDIREIAIKLGFIHITIETEFEGEHCSMPEK